TLKNFQEVGKMAKQVGPDLQETAQEFRLLSKMTRDTIPELKNTNAEIGRAAKKWGDVGERADVLLKTNEDKIVKSIERTEELLELMQVVARSDGTVQRLLTDPSLYNNLNDSAVMATKILPRLDRVLRDVEIFADKIARHPELIGLRGAIVPSIGLKESPSVIPYRVVP